MWKIIDDILSIGSVQKGCKCEEGKGRLSLVAKHNELVCIVRINDSLLKHLGIKEDDIKADDYFVIYTSCKLRFKMVLVLIELKASSQLREIIKAKKQLKTLVESLKNCYGRTWKEFLRECVAIALIVHDRPAIQDGTEENLKGIRLFYLRNPVRDKSFRKILKKIGGKL